MSANPDVNPASFRDPDAFVYSTGAHIFRQINPSYFADYRKLMDSGLYKTLTANNMLIPHEEFGEVEDAITLHPERIPFISYPYEWCFGQLKEAALLTLDIQSLAIAHGMSLKDASAFNVQFHKGRAVFIDTSSFESRAEGKPWVAYRQFCEHFLVPLTLMAKADLSLNSLLATHLDGIPLELAGRLLPLKAKCSLTVLMHIILHNRFAKKHNNTTPANPGSAAKTAHVSANAMRGLIDQLRSYIAGLDVKLEESEWLPYYGQTNYKDDADKLKEATVSEWIERTAPRSIWDFGANTGRYSRLGSNRSIPTLAFDSDIAVIESLYRQSAGKEPFLLPLHMDLSNPSSGVGWEQQERSGLIERGPAGLVMALALIHHLAIGRNIPLDYIAHFFARCGEMLIVEMIPKQDSQIQKMLSCRKDIFTRYNTEEFEAAFLTYFNILEQRPLGENSRVLYLMKKKHA